MLLRPGGVMIWLEAVLAFALTMLVFSTMVSVIVEALHRLSAMRERGFRRMLEQLYDEVVVERFAAALSANGGAARDEYLEALTNNPGWPPEKRGLLGKFLNWWAPRKLTSLTTMQFVERLAGTDVGRAIRAEGAARLETLVNDMAQKYERFGDGAREYYRRRAKMASVLIAMGLAFFANVDAVRLFKAYLNDEQLTADVIAQSEEIQQKFEMQEERLRELRDKVDRKEPLGGDQLEEAQKLTATVREDLEALSARGIPVGYEFYPGCRPPAADPACATLKTKTVEAWFIFRPLVRAAQAWGENPLDFLGWFLSVVLGGVLIGLGGPFWYDTVRSLSRVVQLARAAGVGRKPEAKEGEAPAAAEGKAPPPRTPVEAFETASNAEAAGGRLLAHI